MTHTTIESKKRTITLTDRAPVTIREDQWPLIAGVEDRPGSTRNGTPVPNYETDLYWLRVRKHTDGRMIVYGALAAATAWTGSRDARAGELLGTGADVAAAIRRVAANCQCERLVAECIADLPAEEI